MVFDYPITFDYIQSKWRQRPGGNRIPRYGVAHDTGNPGSTARQNVNYFNRQNLSSSAHVFIDDKEIIVMIPLTEKAYHVRANVSDANDWAIGVELCYGGRIIFEEAYARYVWFWTYLCERYNFNPKTQIKGHYMLDPTRRSDPINAFSKNNITWNQFISDVQNNVSQTSIGPRTSINLRRGATGEGVAEIQRQLTYLGFYSDQVDGSFGPNTDKAVLQFQKAYKLKEDGIVGPITAGALQDQYEKKQANEPLQRGDTGNRVELLQRHLKTLGYYSGAFDGSFGPKTEAAVRSFQKDQRISVDGSVGPITKGKLEAAINALASQSPTPPTDKPGPKPDSLYRVQIGVFDNEENAKTIADKARKQGFDVAITPIPKINK